MKKKKSDKKSKQIPWPKVGIPGLFGGGRIKADKPDEDVEEDSKDKKKGK
jgi:hypothetical protein